MLQSVKNTAHLERIAALIFFILAEKKPKDKLISNAWGRYVIQEDLLNVEIKAQKKNQLSGGRSWQQSRHLCGVSASLASQKFVKVERGDPIALIM